MFLKGIIYTLYKNKLVKFYPKTLAEQVIIDRKSEKTLLDKLTNMATGEAIDDPDKALLNGQSYTIINSVKMPDLTEYVITPIRYDDDSVYQRAVCIESEEKFERWFHDGTWSVWKEVSNSLVLSSVSVRCDITADNSYLFKNPIAGFNPVIQHISALIINTSYVTADKFDVTATDIRLYDTENPVDINDEVYVVLHQLIKVDGELKYNFDGRRIAPKTITHDKIADEAFMSSDDVTNGTGAGKIVGQDALTKKGELIAKSIRDIMDEIVPDTVLIHLNHDLLCYPISRLVCGRNGLGVSGLGEHPLGGTDVYSLPSKTGFDDKNNITIYVPKNYAITNPQLEKLTDTQYMITFTDSVVSIMIDLIVV